MKEPVIEVRNVFKKFVIGKVPVWPLRGATLSIYPGEFVVIHGPSGCGKTTLLNMIAGLDNYDSGEIMIRGKDIQELSEGEKYKLKRSNIGMVFQAFNLVNSLTALENVAMPLGFSGVAKKEREERAQKMLQIVGLGHRISHYPTELSGGEQQKVAIARALVSNPSLLLVDEPTGNLDTKASREIMALLSELNAKYRRTILLVTHDPDYYKLANRILHMQDGVIRKEEIVSEEERIKDERENKNSPFFIPSKTFCYMKSVDVLRLAFKHFKHARTRTALTIWGMVIGISAIILMVSLGFGLQKITTSSLADFDSLQTITASVPDNSQRKLNDSDVQKIKDLANVRQVSPVLSLTAAGTLFSTSTGITLKGVSPDNLKFEQITIKQGTSFSSNEASEAIISETALKNFDITDVNKVINQPIKIEIIETDTKNKDSDWTKTSIKNLELTVVGITGEKMLPELYVPIKTLNKVIPGYSAINIKIADLKIINETKDAIEALDLETSAISELIEQIDKAFLVIQILLGLFGSIALIVASFGIINTMTISLLERTHEVGIMKALGIAKRDIKRIFAYEAALFGVFGGSLGITMGWLGGQMLNLLVYAMMKKTGETEILTPFITPYKFAILVFLFAIGIAWIAGLYPARRAAKLSPLDALRYE